MKTRITSIALVLALIFTLAGCGTASTTSTESKFNAGNTALAKQAISAVDSYLNGRSTADAAYDTVDTIYHQVDEADENANTLEVYLGSVRSKLGNMKSGLGSATLTDVIESRDKLAAYVGVDPY